MQGYYNHKELSTEAMQGYYNFKIDMRTEVKVPISYTRFQNNASMLKQQPAQQSQSSEEESFQLQFHQIKKLGLKPNHKKLRMGGWNINQNAIYLQFMKDNYDDFLTEKARRATKVFFRLSKILKKRTPDQCRSHHQKLQLKFQDDVDKIMKQVQIKINRTLAEEYVNEQMKIQNYTTLTQTKLRQMSKTLSEKNIFQTVTTQNGKKRGDWYKMEVCEGRIRLQIQTDKIATYRPY